MKVVQRHLDEIDPPGTSGHATVGVVLLHLGGPDDEASIESYYRSLWSDPDLFPTGFFSRSKTRVECAWAERGDELKAAYRLIGGRSPVRDLLEAQALALENYLHERPVMGVAVGGVFRVIVGTRFGRPSIEDAVQELKRSGVKHVVALPLYPHADPAPLTAIRREWDRASEAHGLTAPVNFVESFHREEGYLSTVIGRTERSFDLIPPDVRERAFLLFSVLSPPRKRARSGGLLPRVEETAQSVMRAVGRDEERAAVAFQNRGGPGEWLEPTTEAFAVERARSGELALVVVPLSLVTDDFDTLHTLDISVYGAATEAGVKQYRRVPTLNAEPRFIECLASVVTQHIPENVRVVSSPDEGQES